MSKTAALLLALAASAAVSRAQVSSVVGLSNGVQVKIGTSADPGAAGLRIELQPASGKSFYRIFRDENDLVVFAYELQVDRTPDGQQFRITAKPVKTEFAARFPNADVGKPVPTLSADARSPLLGSGGRFSIGIPTNPALSQTLTDTVQVRIYERGMPPADAGPAASAELRFSALKVSINGHPASPSGPGSSVAGRYVMFYIPGRGGYFFSNEPVERREFLHIGRVDHDRLQFTLENDTYDCNADAAILTRSDRGQIWVYHDPAYRPAGNWTQSDPSQSSRNEFFTAASDSLQWWVP